ncbi:hypothetical protein J3E69DRAFT_337709 [Trichoderma sp. SZMC 28015]
MKLGLLFLTLCSPSIDHCESRRLRDIPGTAAYCTSSVGVLQSICCLSLYVHNVCCLHLSPPLLHIGIPCPSFSIFVRHTHTPPPGPGDGRTALKRFWLSLKKEKEKQREGKGEIM